MTRKHKDGHPPASDEPTDAGALRQGRREDLVVPQSVFAPQLVRNPGESAAITRWLERICTSVEKDALPIVRDALVHETTNHAADDWMTVARASLAHLLEAPEIDRSATAQLDRHLQEAIAKGLPAPSDDEVLHHTGEVVATMVTSWLEVLRKLTQVHSTVMLNEYLLPPKSLDEELFRRLMRALDPYAVGQGDGAGTIMKSLARTLFEEGPRVGIPYGISLAVTSRATDGLPKTVQASQSR